MYEGLKVNFWLWHIVGGVYGYKELIRLPRKQKKALKKSILQDVITVDRTYVKECPRPKKLPTFSYKQLNNPRQIIPQWQKDLAGWADKKWIFKSCEFKDFTPRKGFVCSEYFKSNNV